MRVGVVMGLPLSKKSSAVHTALGRLFLLLLCVIAVAGAQETIRVGVFPILRTHRRWSEKRTAGSTKLRGQVNVRWISFNPGPSAIEALFAGANDMTYVGPTLAINGNVRSNGEALRAVAGAARRSFPGG